MSIIPQEPMLFSGSLRDNLDPWQKYTDIQLWDALAEVYYNFKIIIFSKKCQKALSMYNFLFRLNLNLL